MNSKINTVWWVLRIGLGLAPFLAGLDKFFNILADWDMYLSPLATKIIPISPQLFMRIAGVIEMAVGIAVLAGLTRLGGYVVMLWLIAIAINLLTTGMFYDIAVRDVEMSLGAFALAKLSEVRAESLGRVPEERRARVGASAA
ncbi:MAG: DoxX family membrane protein [Thermoanaerobaculia bacterium]